MRFTPGGCAADQRCGLTDGLKGLGQLALDFDLVLFLMDGDPREEGLVEPPTEFVRRPAIRLVAVLAEYERERQIGLDVRHLGRKPVEPLRNRRELPVDRALLVGVEVRRHDAIKVAVEQLPAAVAKSGALSGKLRPETLLPFSLVRHLGPKCRFELLPQIRVEGDGLVQLDDATFDQRNR